jgi:regulation of enolase protein 1 (concanavalin A-like superfamily)/transcriptional regulator with XRE-family HTH domain
MQYSSNLIAFYREHCNPSLTQEQLAVELDVHVNTVQRWEREGAPNAVRLLQLTQIFKAGGAIKSYDVAEHFWNVSGKGGAAFPKPPELRHLFTEAAETPTPDLSQPPEHTLEIPGSVGAAASPLDERPLGRSRREFTTLMPQPVALPLGIGITILAILWLLLPYRQPVARALQPTELLFQIQATRGWQDTGLIVMPGDTIRISAVSGEWTTHQGVDAYVGAGGYSGVYHEWAASHIAIYGAVLGSIAGSEPFEVGTGVIVLPAQTGPLRLRINDANCDACLQDNGGAQTVRISVEPDTIAEAVFARGMQHRTATLARRHTPFARLVVQAPGRSDQVGDRHAAPLVGFPVHGDFQAYVGVVFQPERCCQYAGLGVRSAHGDWLRISLDHAQTLQLGGFVQGQAPPTHYVSYTKQRVVLRVTRRGDVLTFWYSADGQHWMRFHMQRVPDLPLDIELFVTVFSAHNDSPVIASFSNVVIDQ